MSTSGIEIFRMQNGPIGNDLRTKISERNEIAESNKSDGGQATTFSDLLKSTLTEANQAQLDANSAINEVVAGRNKDLHGVMLALEKADVSLRLLTQIRNKMIDAYREIMKMQV